jgi:hypothetical protein
MVAIQASGEPLAASKSAALSHDADIGLLQRLGGGVLLGQDAEDDAVEFCAGLPVERPERRLVARAATRRMRSARSLSPGFNPLPGAFAPMVMGAILE